jgi:hypothetical protein
MRHAARLRDGLAAGGARSTTLLLRAGGSRRRHDGHQRSGSAASSGSSARTRGRGGIRLQHLAARGAARGENGRPWVKHSR